MQKTNHMTGQREGAVVGVGEFCRAVWQQRARERPGRGLWETGVKSPNVTCAVTANVALGQSKETEGESESDLSRALARKSLDLWTKEPLAVWFPLRLLSDCVRDWRWCDLLSSLGFAFGVLHSYISKNWLQLRCLLAFFLLNLHIAEKICIFFFFLFLFLPPLLLTEITSVKL